MSFRVITSPTQGDILPFQHLDSVTAEDRIDTFGDVSCGVRSQPLSVVRSVPPFCPAHLRPSVVFCFMQFRYVGFQRIGHCLSPRCELSVW